MIKYTNADKTLVVPSGLGNFGQGSGSGGGVTPQQAAEIASAVTEAAIDEYDTEIQVDLEELRDAISASTGTLLDLAEIAAMSIADRVALFDEIFEKASNGEKIYIKGLVQEETIRTAILPLVSYRPETNPVLHQGGNLYFAAKGDTDNVYFHIGLTSEGSIDPTSGNIIKRNIYNLPTASAEVKGGVRVGSGLTMTQDTLSLDTTGLVTDGDLAPFIVQQSANTENIATLSAATEAISESLGNYATTATTDELATAISGVSDSLANYATTATTDALSAVTSALTENLEALSAVTSGLTEAVAGKQDTLSAGNGIDLSGNTISVKIGEGLAFSGDTIVTDGGGGATTYILNRMSQQERKDLFDELFEYRDGYGVSSSFPAGNYAFYYNEDNGDDFNGLIPLTIVMMHPTDYDGGIFFTGLAKNRYNQTNLRMVRYVITSDGSVDENRYGASFGINTAGYNFSWTGDISVDLDNGNIIKRGDETLVSGTAYSDFESDSSLLDMMQKGLKFEPANTTIYSPTFKISLISSGTTKTYYKPVIYYEEISPVTIGGKTFSKKFYFVYTKEDGGKFSFSYLSRSSNIAANFEYQALS